MRRSRFGKPAVPVLAGMLTLVILGISEERCPDTICHMESWSGHQYAFCYEPGDEKDWESARRSCGTQNPPMDLVAINSAEEQAFVDAVWNSIRGEATPIENHMGNPEYIAYIGFNDLRSEGAWEWSNGDRVSYTHWCDHEPNNAGDEDCAVTGWSADYENGPECPELAWNDIPCVATVAYICEEIDTGSVHAQ